MASVELLGFGTDRVLTMRTRGSFLNCIAAWDFVTASCVSCSRWARVVLAGNKHVNSPGRNWQLDVDTGIFDDCERTSFDLLASVESQWGYCRVILLKAPICRCSRSRAAPFLLCREKRVSELALLNSILPSCSDSFCQLLEKKIRRDREQHPLSDNQEESDVPGLPMKVLLLCSLMRSSAF